MSGSGREELELVSPFLSYPVIRQFQAKENPKRKKKSSEKVKLNNQVYVQQQKGLVFSIQSTKELPCGQDSGFPMGDSIDVVGDNQVNFLLKYVSNVEEHFLIITFVFSIVT